MPDLPASIPDVADVELLRGAEADPDAAPDLLVEVPHGADERVHYEKLRGRLQGDLPADLWAFFHVNTDEGAWAYGRATAEAVLAAAPRRSALVVRSLVPRTFVDCNRPADYAGELGRPGGLTAGIPAYVRDPRDRELLLGLHRQYVELVEAAYVVVCGAGGQALVPHTYAPRTLDIASVGDDIVELLRAGYAEDQVERWPLRAEVDLLTRDGDGGLLAPEGVEEALRAGFAAVGLESKVCDTYHLHAGALGHGLSLAYPGRVTCLEVRRDLLVDHPWRPFEEERADPVRAARIAGVLAPVLEALLSQPHWPSRAGES